MSRAVLSTVVAAVTALLLLNTAPARAEFENERSLYLLMRVELENARQMERFFQAKLEAAEAAAFQISANRDRRWSKSGCDDIKPWAPERCWKIRDEFFDAIRTLRTYVRGFEAAIFFQSLEVDRLRNEYAAAVANYVAQVALQAAVLPPEPEVQVSPQSPQPPVRRRPPGQQATPTQRRSNDMDRILRETQRRLQALQPLSRRGF